MRHRHLIYLLLAGLLPAASHAAPVFTPDQEARIGQIAGDYLLAHPDILVRVSEKQQQAQEEQVRAITRKVQDHQTALLRDPGTPAYGPADAPVSVVEFFDYQCLVCARQASVLSQFMQAPPEVRFVFKEWPIFASRWPVSGQAARTGLQTAQQKGADAYLTYHNALFATGHNEGNLTADDIRTAARAMKLTAGKGADVSATLAGTDELARTLGLQGTPGLIVMPSRGATAESITVIPGGTDLATLEQALARATGK